jgi:hypothetical protein
MPSCAQCGREHEELEPGFRRPDAVFAVPEEERAERVRQSDDLTSIDDAVFFLRAVAPIPVHGRNEPYQWGFWAKVSKANFEEYLRYFDTDPPLDHPGFPATLANQSTGQRPTLGLPVHVQLNRGRARPSLMLLDASHPLTCEQEQGVSETVVHAWSARASEGSDTEPAGEPRVTELEREGWCVANPDEVGKRAQVLDALPRAGDVVKASFRYLAADARGEVETRVEHMWVLLDTIRADGWWSGTLDNRPFVPGPLGYGTRVWLRPAQITAVSSPDPGPDEAARSRLLDRLRRWTGRRGPS